MRYDSPIFGGFRFEVSYTDNYGGLSSSAVGGPRGGPRFDAPEVWDGALCYADDWGDFKISAAYSYTQSNGNYFSVNPLSSTKLHQAGATVMHVPSGVGLYGYINYEEVSGTYTNFRGAQQGVPDWNSWYFRPFIKRTRNPLGATVLYGEYALYNDGFNGIAAANTCAGFGAGTNAANDCGGNATNGVFVTGSQIQRYGLGAVQEIDAAAMHVFARWQFMEADVGFVGFNSATGAQQNVSQGFDDFNVFQVGGIIFF